MERLKLAREFLGPQDPLDFFQSWKTPGERHVPRYTEPDVDAKSQTSIDEENEDFGSSEEDAL